MGQTEWTTFLTRGGLCLQMPQKSLGDAALERMRGVFLGVAEKMGF
jgi:hypothetical protein